MSNPVNQLKESVFDDGVDTSKLVKQLFKLIVIICPYDLKAPIKLQINIATSPGTTYCLATAQDNIVLVVQSPAIP